MQMRQMTGRKVTRVAQKEIQIFIFIILLLYRRLVNNAFPIILQKALKWWLKQAAAERDREVGSEGLREEVSDDGRVGGKQRGEKGRH